MTTPTLNSFMQFLERAGEILAVILFGTMMYFVLAA